MEPPVTSRLRGMEVSKRIVHCSGCGGRLAVPITTDGKRFRCPTCRQVLDVPGELSAPQRTAAAAVGPMSSTSRSTGRPLPSDQPIKQTTAPREQPRPAESSSLSCGQSHHLLAGLDQKIPRVRSSLGYRAALIGGAALVGLLPLIYLALTIAAGLGVAWWAATGLGVFDAPVGGRGAILLVAIYLAPLFIGCLLVVFMIKPLFFRQARSERGRSLTRDGEPLLFEFVDKLCAAVHAPTPRRIDVDCQVNASAGFRRGLLSFLGGDLVLTIGMPLAAGLSTRQLAGVLAHEFGHFSQSAGMRATYLIISINHWFHRVVYGRDTMDQWLDDAAEDAEHLLLVLILQLARLMVWISRRVLWLLMMIGYACSCVLRRQMEFDADLHQTRLSGSDTFGSTSREAQRLGFAYGEALSRARRAHRDGQLPDDIPALTRFERRRAKPETIAEIDSQAQSAKTGFFDTHPSDAERIARALSDAAPGLYTVEAPAADLFQHFAAICRGVTGDFYRDTFGSVPDAGKIVAVDRLARQQSVEDEAHVALQRLFGTSTSLPWNLRLPWTAPLDVTSGREFAEKLRSTKQLMLDLRESYRAAFLRYDELDTRWLQCSQVTSLRSAGAQLRAADFDVPVSTSAAARREAGKTEAKLAQADLELAPMYDAFALRVTLSLRIASVSKVAARLKDASPRLATANRAIEATKALAPHFKNLAKLRNDFHSLRAISTLFGQQEPSKQLYDEFKMLLDRVCERTKELRDAVAGKPFPFAHADGLVTLDKYLVPKLPLNADPGGVFDAAEGCLDRAYSLFFRCAAHLASITVDVETILGIPPDPEADTQV